MTRRLSATQGIAIVTVAISLLALLTNNALAVVKAGFIPGRLSGAIDIPSIVPAWLTPLTSTLLHGSMLHLTVNMVMLLLIGSRVERVVGSSGLVIAYLIGAIAASAAQFAVDPIAIMPVVGASGAISALFALYALFFGKPPQATSNQKVNRAIHVAWLFAAWILVNWIMAYMARADGVIVATPAHIGGFVSGLLLQRPLLLWRYRDA